MLPVHADPLHAIAKALGASTSGAKAPPWDDVLHLGDGTTVGVACVAAKSVTTEFLEALDKVSQDLHLTQGLVVANPALSDEELTDLDRSTVTTIEITSLQEIQARAKRRTTTTVLGTERSQGLPEALKEIRRRLLNLTSTNVLISLKDTKTTLHLDASDPLVVLQALVTEREQVEVLTAQEPIPRGPRGWLAATLRCSLERTALDLRLRAIEREFQDRITGRGLNELYVALGCLAWTDGTAGAEDAKVREAPLVLVPLTMERERVVTTEEILPGDPAYQRPGQTREVARYRYRLAAEDAAPRENPSLILKLEQEYDIPLPTLAAYTDEDGAVDLRGYLDGVAASVKRQPETAHWKVLPKVFIGFFSYTKAVMEEDLSLDNWSGNIPGLPLLEAALMGSAPKEAAEISDDAVAAAQLSPALVTIDDCDSSQAKAILMVDQGHDVVIQGPPGTGKSQTITNLIAQAMASGKRVLFVSEKKAALEVVRSRLTRRGLGDFLLPLHDTKLGAQEMHQVLRQRIGKTLPRASTYSQDIGQMAQVAAPLSSLAEVLRTEIRPSQTPTDLLWATSALRTAVLTLRSRGDLDALMEECRLPAPPAVETLTLAEEVLAELEILAKSGLFDRCDCWTGFLVVPLDPPGCQAIERALVAACQQTDELTTAAQTFGDRGWRWDDQPWTTIRQTVNRILVQDLPSEGITTDADRTIKAWGSSGSLPGRVQEVLAAVAAERATVAAITTTLGSLPDVAWLESIRPALQGPASGSFTPSMPLRAVYQLTERVRTEVPRIQTLVGESQHLAARLGLPGLTTLNAWNHLAALLAATVAAPPELSQTLGSHQAAPNFMPTLARVLGAVTAVQDQQAALAKIVVWEDVPQEEQVLSNLRQDLRAGHGRWTSWVPWSRYAAARRACRRFLVDPTRWGQTYGDLLGALSEIPKVRQQVQDLAVDQDAKATLGTLFQGATTDRHRLAHLQELLTQIAAHCPYASLATVLGNLGDLAKDRVELQRLAGVCQEGARILTSLVAAVDTATQGHRPRQPEATIEAVLADLGHVAALGAQVEPFLRLHDLPSAVICQDAWDAARRRDQLEQDRQGIQKSLHALRLPTGIPQAETVAQEVLTWQAQVDHLPAPLRAWVCQQTAPVSDTLATLWDELTANQDAFTRLAAQGIDTFRRYSRPQSAPWPPVDVSIQELAADLRQCRDQAEDLPGWSRIVEITTRVEGLPGLEALVTALLHQSPPLSVADARTLWAWACHEAESQVVLKARPDLRTFDRARHEARRQRFAKQDKDLADSAVVQVVERLLRLRPPSGNAVGKVSDKTDMALVLHELGKTRAFIPVRAMVQRAGNALQALLPCWMMSPLSVSWYLPRNGFQFDLVIMDEASQIRPEDSMGALMRAKQAVIVGDTKQMPPDRTFDSGSKLDGLFTASSMESVLALAENCGRFRQSMLRWHYRSRHQSLIAFSNARYYDGNLMVFPSVHRHQSTQGITRIHLPDARYSKQLNPREADEVVRQVLLHGTNNLTLPPAQRSSIGVASMNAAQRDLILDLLDARCSQDAEARKVIDGLYALPEPLFIQNLENIQGDERDHIIISFTYGPDEASGVVMQRFGPILQSGGERRLNVLFTRARVRLTAITSMQSSDIKATAASSRGHRDLQAYLAYLETGKLPQEGAPSERSGTHDSPFEQEVASVLSGLGLAWESQVGVAGYFVDLGLYDPKRPGQFLLGIECDGATYHSSRVARDRDRLREEVLRSRGWDIYRIWSSDWFQNRSMEVDRLCRYVQAKSRK